VGDQQKAGKPQRRGASPKGLQVVRDQAKTCRRCDLWKHATQTVFGAGPVDAHLMLVGEQPGDAEDRAGEPFVGPAGRLLREALEEAGIDPGSVYLTNAVKHFKFEERGKRRIHKKPRSDEILACRVWLDEEIARVRPRAIVALGATAAGVVIGPAAKVTRDRGKPFRSPLAEFVTLTVHPSSILRAPDSAARAEARRQFVDDLRAIAKRLRSHAG
jgi:uracil-DNA glycosylase